MATETAGEDNGRTYGAITKTTTGHYERCGVSNQHRIGFLGKVDLGRMFVESVPGEAAATAHFREKLLAMPGSGPLR